MKQIVYIVSVLILCVLMQGKAHAQVLPLNNPVWTLGVVPKGDDDFNRMTRVSLFKLDGDTVVGGRTYHALYFAEWDGTGLPVIPDYRAQGGLRIDGKKIWGVCFNWIEEDFLVFDFGANIGDTICHGTKALSIVRDIQETLLGKAITIDYGKYDENHSFVKDDTDVWIEGVGPIQGFFIFVMPQTGYYARVRKLWRLIVDNELRYPEEDPGPLYIGDLQSLTQTEINPVRIHYEHFAEKLSIQADESSYPYFLEIMTISGSVLATKWIHTDTAISLEDLPSGSYICVLSKDRKVVTSQKILR